MIQAKKMMRPGTPSLSYDATVHEAIELFRNQNEGFVAIKAAEDRYQGVLTEGNLVRIYLRFQSQPEPSAAGLLNRHRRRGDLHDLHQGSGDRHAAARSAF